MSKIRTTSEQLELNNVELSKHINLIPFLEKSIPRLAENQEMKEVELAVKFENINSVFTSNQASIDKLNFMIAELSMKQVSMGCDIEETNKNIHSITEQTLLHVNANNKANDHQLLVFQEQIDALRNKHDEKNILSKNVNSDILAIKLDLKSHVLSNREHFEIIDQSLPSFKLYENFT